MRFNHLRRREFITLLGGAAVAWPRAASAQQTRPVIGVLGRTTSEEYAFLMAAFRKSLAEAGYVEGQNVTIEYRWADNHANRLPTMASELVQSQVSVIFTSGGASPPLAAKAATTTIPIVFAIGTDPITSGLVASISRPGGNVTGASFLAPEVVSKQMAILRELIPSATVIGVPVNKTNPDIDAVLRDVQEASRALGFHVAVEQVHSAGDFDSAFAGFARQRADAVLVGFDRLFLAGRHQLIVLAARHGLPAIFEQRESALAGGLISYGPSATESYRHAGSYVGRILKGAKPADLPVMLPTKYELVINLKTAKTFGLDIPPTLLARADEVIE
jgi:putative tryptophan/tyrosine transport system substrate-binding protein